MFRLNWLAMLLVFIIMAGLFFVSGYITCYITFPPRPAHLLGSQNYNQQSLMMQQSSNNGEIIVDKRRNSTNYSYRQKLLKSFNSNQAQSYLQQAENESKNEASEAVRSSFSQVLDEWSQKIRDTLGPLFGGVVAPLTTGLARTVVDETFSPTYGTEFKTHNDQAVSGIVSIQPQDQKPSKSVMKDVEHYSILIENFDDSDRALELAQDLKSKHYGAYVVRIPTSTGLQYSVRAGAFTTYRDAQAAASTLSRMWSHPTRVVTIDKTIDDTDARINIDGGS